MSELGAGLHRGSMCHRWAPPMNLERSLQRQLPAATAHACASAVLMTAPPTPAAGSIRTLNMLRILLNASFNVTFVPTVPQCHPKYPAHLQALGVDVLPPRSGRSGGWRLTGRGSDGCPFHLVLVARRNVYLSMLGALERQCPGLPWVYDTVDLHYLREARDAITAGADRGLRTTAASGAGASQVGAVVQRCGLKAWLLRILRRPALTPVPAW